MCVCLWPWLFAELHTDTHTDLFVLASRAEPSRAEVSCCFRKTTFTQVRRVSVSPRSHRAAFMGTNKHGGWSRSSLWDVCVRVRCFPLSFTCVAFSCRSWRWSETGAVGVFTSIWDTGTFWAALSPAGSQSGDKHPTDSTGLTRGDTLTYLWSQWNHNRGGGTWSRPVFYWAHVIILYYMYKYCICTWDRTKCHYGFIS